MYGRFYCSQHTRARHGLKFLIVSDDNFILNEIRRHIYTRYILRSIQPTMFHHYIYLFDTIFQTIMELSPTCKNFGPEIWPRIFTPKFFPKKQPQCNFGEKIALETDLSPHCDNSQNTVSLFNFSGRRRPLQICEISHET